MGDKRKRKLVTKIAAIVGIVFIVILAIVIAIPIVFKDDLVKIAKRETNKAVNAKIDFGDFDLSLIRSFPNLHLAMNNLKIVGINQFDSLELASIKELSLVVDLMSVINGGSIQVKEVMLIEPKIYAKLLADGSANYLIAKEDTTLTASTDSLNSSAGFKMDLQKVEIIDGIVIYEDLTLPMRLDIHDLDLIMNGDLTENITNLSSKGEIATVNMTFDGIQYITDAKAILDVVMEINVEEMKFTFKENEVKLNELPLAFNGWLVMPNEAIDMDVTFAAKESKFIHFLSMIPAEFAKDLEGVETNGVLAFDGYAKGTFLDTIYPAFGVNLMVENGSFKYPDLPKSVEDIQIKAKVESKDGDLNNLIVDVPTFHFNMAQNPFDATFYLATPISDPYIKAGLKGRLDLNQIKDMIPMEKNDQVSGIVDANVNINGNLSSIENEQYEKFNAEGMLNATGIKFISDSLDYPIDISTAKLQFNPGYLNLEQLNMLLGKSDISASGRVENYLGYALKDNQTLKGLLTVNSKFLDINELAGIEPSAPSTTEAKQASSSVESAPMQVVVLPKNIDFVTNANITKLVYDNVVLEEIKGKVEFKDQKLALQNTSMKLLGGSMLMSGFYETTDSLKPTYDFGLNIQNFELAKTLETFTSIGQLVPLAKFAKGSYSTSLNVTGALNNLMEPIFESIFGAGSMLTKEMTIDGYQPLEKISKLIKYDKINPLNINNQKIQFKMAEGKVYVEPFDFNIGETKLTIAGSNAFDQSIDYVFSFAIPRKELGGSLNSAADGLFAQAKSKGINIDLAETINVDVKLKGPFTSPTISTDLKKTASNAADALKNQAKEEIEKKKEEFKQQAQDELEKQREEARKKAEDEIKRQQDEARKKLEEESKKKLKGLFGN